MKELQRHAGSLEQLVAERCREKALAGPHEQGLAHPCFELPDALAHRGLGDVELPRHRP